MKQSRWIRKALALVVCAALAATALPLVTAGPDTNVGRHAFKVNIIGRPNAWSGSDSGSESNTVFISLKTNAGSVQCEASSGVVDDGVGADTTSAVPSGRETIYFSAGPFDVLDRDATDGSARIQMPANVAGYDIYVRVLGKPGGCLDADAYAWDADGALYYYAGHLDANRKTGAPEKVRVNELFYVNVDLNADGDATDAGEHISVFDGMFEDYFWQIENSGLRNMQLIFYAV